MAAIPARDYKVGEEIQFQKLADTRGGGQSAYTRSKKAPEKSAALVAVSGLSMPFGLRTPMNESDSEMSNAKGAAAITMIRARQAKSAMGSVKSTSEAPDKKGSSNMFRCVASCRVSPSANEDFHRVVSDADALAAAEFTTTIKPSLPTSKQAKIAWPSLRQSDHIDETTGHPKYDPMVPLKVDVMIPTNESVDFLFAGSFDPKTGMLNDRDAVVVGGREIMPERLPFNACRLLRRNKNGTIVNRLPVKNLDTGKDLVCERTGRVILRYFDMRDLEVTDIRDAIAFSAKIEINSLWMNATSYGLTWLARELVFDEADPVAREETATLVDADGTVHSVTVGFVMPEEAAAAAASSSSSAPVSAFGRPAKRERESDESTEAEPSASQAVPAMTAEEWDEFATKALNQE